MQPLFPAPYPLVSFPDRLSSVCITSSITRGNTKSDPCWGWLGLGPRLPIPYNTDDSTPTPHSLSLSHTHTHTHIHTHQWITPGKGKGLVMQFLTHGEMNTNPSHFVLWTSLCNHTHIHDEISDPRKLFPQNFAKGQSAKILPLEHLALYGISIIPSNQ